MNVRLWPSASLLGALVTAACFETVELFGGGRGLEGDSGSVPDSATLVDRTWQHACGGEAYASQRKNLEILVLFDESASMALPVLDFQCLTVSPACASASGLPPTVWEVAVAELKDFLDDPRSAGIGIALKYFGNACESAAYANPDVPLGTLPGRAEAIAQSLDATFPLADTATRPALEGAIQFMRQRAERSSYNARPMILIITDGDGDEKDCTDNTGDDIVRVTSMGLAQSPSIATYVFATVPNPYLDAIAAGGGTDHAVLVDLSKSGALSDALNQVREREVSDLPCQYALPPEYFAELNEPSRVNLTRDGRPIAGLAAAADCAAQDGWYYDDPADPSYVIACPSTCVRLSSGSIVEIVLRCKTVTKTPPSE